MIRLEHFADGALVDELYAERVDVELLRQGQASYRLDVRGAASVSLELWTGEAGRIALTPKVPLPEWARATYDEDGALEALSCRGVDVHLEHLDRGSYFFGLSRGGEHRGLTLSARGFLKARVLPPSSPEA